MVKIFSVVANSNKSLLLLIFLSFMFLPFIINAQQSINTLGSNIKTHSGSITYTLGQIDYISLENRDAWMNQGVQQPYISVTDAVHESEGCIVFPNPTTGLLSFNLSDSKDISLNYQIYSVNGVLAGYGEKIKGTDRINISNIMPGIYIIKIISEKTKVWECMIVKI
jgi:hypothetical protein